MSHRESAARIISMVQAYREGQMVPIRLLLQAALVLAKTEMAASDAPCDVSPEPTP